MTVLDIWLNSPKLLYIVIRLVDYLEFVNKKKSWHSQFSWLSELWQGLQSPSFQHVIGIVNMTVIVFSNLTELEHNEPLSIDENQ